MNSIFPWLLSAVLLSLIGSVQAADAYLAIQNQSKSVATDQPNGWAPVLGYQHGGGSTISISDLLAPKMVPKISRITLGSDRSMADLMNALQRGEMRDLTLQVIQPPASTDGEVVKLEVTFSDCLFSSIHADVSTSIIEPIFTVQFAYSEIRWIITIIDPKDGDLSAIGTGYDVIENRLMQIGNTAVPKPYVLSNVGGGAPGDSDNDGIPDSWETLYGLNPNNSADSIGDSDRDGFTNFQEYLTGTDPTQANSFFQIAVSEPLNMDSTGVSLRWTSVAGGRYNVLVTDDLTQPFTVLTNVTAATGSETRYFAPLESGPFFKVELIAP